MIALTTPSVEAVPVRGQLEDRYFARMAAAVDEKSQITSHLTPGTVADIGAGGGQLAVQMARHPRI